MTGANGWIYQATTPGSKLFSPNRLQPIINETRFFMDAGPPAPGYCEHGTDTRYHSCAYCKDDAAAELQADLEEAAEAERHYRADTANMSAQDATLDELVERASRPTLSSLYQRGKDAGLIKPAQDYGHTYAA